MTTCPIGGLARRGMLAGFAPDPFRRRLFFMNQGCVVPAGVPPRSIACHVFAFFVSVIEATAVGRRFFGIGRPLQFSVCQLPEPICLVGVPVLCVSRTQLYSKPYEAACRT